jgi:hypothetical protein
MSNLKELVQEGKAKPSNPLANQMQQARQHTNTSQSSEDDDYGV